MKVKDSNASNTRTTAEIDLFDEVLVTDETVRSKIKQETGQYLLEIIQQFVGNETSPVQGEGKFKKLSKAYAAFKDEYVGNKLANLELTGDMLSALDFRETEDGIEIGVFGDQAPKADGHNNFSGDSRIPQRRFIPDKGQEFVPEISDNLRQIIANQVADSDPLTKDDLEGVDSKASLYNALSKVFDGLDRSEIRTAILTSDPMRTLLDDEDLLDLL